MAKTDKWPDKDIGKPNPGRQIVKADLCLTALWVISIVVMTTGCMLIGQWTLRSSWSPITGLFFSDQL